MSRFSNKRAASFLASIPEASLDREDDTLTKRCRFNFSYFDVQRDAGQDFKDWTHDQLVKLLESLKQYSEQPLKHWLTQPIGKSGTVYAHYGKFPGRSEFERPKHVPHQAEWGRFRLGLSIRLVGFTVPKSLDDKEHPRTGRRYCSNTFYVVFLDANHQFWVSEAK